MKYDADVHRRRSIRLHGYDYSLPGAYFVTLCAFKKERIFGHVVENQMHENECGKIVREQWLESARIRKGIELDAFIVMPNHLHGILWFLGPKGEHILMNSGFTWEVGPSGARPGSNATRHAPRPRATEPYKDGRTPFGPTNPTPAMRPRSLASWAAGFKSAVTSRIRKHWKRPDAAVWQEDYFERIIRDEDELFRIRDYILSNPARWRLDRENPEAGPDAQDEVPWGPVDLG